jgi:hypothetical protein
VFIRGDVRSAAPRQLWYRERGEYAGNFDLLKSPNVTSPGHLKPLAWYCPGGVLTAPHCPPEFFPLPSICPLVALIAGKHPQVLNEFLK